MSEGQGIQRRYQERTGRSLELWREFSDVLVDGNTRSLAYYPPHPLVIVSGRGPMVTDADGHTYFDLLNNYTSLVHGNAHPALMEAATAVMATGTVFPAPHALQARHAAMIRERIEGTEVVRYTNSGTEAAMLAVRVARAVTGRDVLAKARYGYHGGFDGLAPNVGGSSGRPEAGVAQATADLLRVFEFNDAADMDRVCREAGSDLAAIVLEPMLGSGGAVPATSEFMAEARRLADELGALLILDEVQTFRLHPGGMQALLGVRADLTVLGKLIGGGFPIGAVAGPRHLLDVLSAGSPRPMKHAGTFNGNLVSMAAGIRAMELLDPAAIARLNGSGETLASSIRDALASSGLPGTVTGYGSMFNVHLGAEVGTVRTGSDATAQDHSLMELFHLALLNEGVFAAPRGFFNTSSALSDEDLEVVAGSLKQALAELAEETSGTGRQEPADR
jgi:glutamate-1-semialdehyde 2,1-aminomutase